MKYFVTATGTDSGKTLASAILVEALQADYFKPIQCGTEAIDSDSVAQLINNDYCHVFQSAFLLKHAASPHEAAYRESINLSLQDMELPETDNTLIIEGAGGLLVPLNYEGDTIADLILHFGAEVILVVNFYLGCINHALLTINELKRRNLKLKGIIFNGPINEHSERIILKHSGSKKLLHIDQEAVLNNEVVRRYAIQLMAQFHD